MLKQLSLQEVPVV